MPWKFILLFENGPACFSRIPLRTRITVAETALATTDSAIYEASKWLLNLSLAVKNPFPAQVELFRGRVTALRDEVERMRLMFLW